MFNKKIKPQLGGGIKVTLTKDYVYPNGQILKANKTPTVTLQFYNELLKGGYLDKPIKSTNSKNK